MLAIYSSVWQRLCLDLLRLGLRVVLENIVPMGHERFVIGNLVEIIDRVAAPSLEKKS